MCRHYINRVSRSCKMTKFRSCKMMFYVSFILLVVSVDVMVAQSNAKFTRCDQIPKQYIEYKWLVDSCPFYVYRGTAPIHKCTRAVYTGPDYNRTDYTGNGIFIEGANTFSYELNLVNNNVWDALLCLDGFKGNYSNVYTNFNSSSAALCVANCAPDGINYNSRSAADEVHIQKFLDTTLKGVPGIVNMQSGCSKSKNCGLLNN